MQQFQAFLGRVWCLFVGHTPDAPAIMTVSQGDSWPLLHVVLCLRCRSLYWCVSDKQEQADNRAEATTSTRDDYKQISAA